MEQGAASSYRIAADGSLVPISNSVPNHQTATCWIAITTNPRFAYTTNNGINYISSYKVNLDGSLSLTHEVAAGDGTVSMFEIDQKNGNLIPLGAHFV